MSLPREWVKKANLRRGDSVSITEENDGGLLIHPSKSHPLSRVLCAELNLEDFVPFKALKYAVGTYYTQGVKRITIKCKNIIRADQKKEIRLFCGSFPGLELTEEDAQMLTFEAALDPAAFDINDLLSKTSRFSLSLQKDAVKCVIEGDNVLANEVLERGEVAVRYYRMAIRQIALASHDKIAREPVGVEDCHECVACALAARDLNRVIYHSTHIATHGLAICDVEISKGILQSILDMSELALSMQKKAVQAFLQKDFDLAVKTMRLMDRLTKKEEEFLHRVATEEKDSDVVFRLRMIGSELRRIGGYSVGIADDALNRFLVPASFDVRSQSPQVMV